MSLQAILLHYNDNLGNLVSHWQPDNWNKHWMLLLSYRGYVCLPFQELWGILGDNKTRCKTLKEQATRTQLHSLARSRTYTHAPNDFTRVTTMQVTTATVDSCFVLLGLISTVYCYQQRATRECSENCFKAEPHCMHVGAWLGILSIPQAMRAE